jgi:signal transduction histidine kinase
LKKWAQPAAHGPQTLWTVIVSVLAAFCLIALALASNTAGAPPVVAFLGSSLACAALVTALRWPVPATVMQCGAVAALGAGALSGHLTEVGIAVLVGHVAIVTLRHRWWLAVGVWWTLLGTCVLITAMELGTGTEAGAGERNETARLVVLAVSSLLVMLAGLAYRQRARISEELAAARRDVALEQERRSLIEERTRIARELHDVVAHGMSVIHMQAVSAPYRLERVDADTRAEFTAIADGARGALAEMRQLLGVLRATDAEPDAEPAPNLDRLSELVEVTRRAGTPVTLEVDPAVQAASETVGTTVYRIAQEALSNVVRHAPGAPAAVHVSRDRSGLTVTVINGAGPHPHLDPVEQPGRPRLGLTGMRERVARLGGDLTFGPQPGGGFRVEARLPLAAETQPVDDSR